MSGRGPQSFKNRQREQQRKERHQEKLAKRLQRKRDSRSGAVAPQDVADIPPADEPSDS